MIDYNYNAKSQWEMVSLFYQYTKIYRWNKIMIFREFNYLINEVNFVVQYFSFSMISLK